MTVPQFLRSSVASELYSRALASVYRGGFQIYDPSQALAKDPEIIRKLFLDPVIAHARQIRRHMVAGQKWQCEPASKSPADVLWAKTCEKLLGRCSGLRNSLFNLSDAVFVGFTLGQIRGERRLVIGPDGIPRNWLVPVEVRDVSKLRFRPIPYREGKGTEDERIGIRWEIFNVARDAWEPLKYPECFVKHKYNDNEASLGFGTGLIDALYYFWRSKELALTEGLGAVERWAQGLVVVKVEGGREASTSDPNTTLLDVAIEQVANHRSRHVLGVDKVDDVTVVPGPSEGYQMVQQMIGYLDSAMTSLILGSTMSSDTGTGGSYASDAVQQDTREMLVQYDRELLSESLTRDLIGYIRRYNQPILLEAGLLAAEDPRFRIVDERAYDPRVRSEILTQYLQNGIPIKREEVYAGSPFTMPDATDDVFEKAPDPMLGFGGLPGLGAPAGGEFTRHAAVADRKAAVGESGKALEDKGEMARFAALLEAAKQPSAQAPRVNVTVNPPEIHMASPTPNVVVQNYDRLEARVDGTDLAAAVGRAVKKEMEDVKVNVNVSVPEAPAPIVNVAAPDVTVSAPAVNIPAPVINVAAPVVERVEVTLKKDPPVAKEITVSRDIHGNLKGEIKPKE
jgi:hypothetical protein